MNVPTILRRIATLRDYQDEAQIAVVAHLLGLDPVFLKFCVGSGKTLIALVTAMHLMVEHRRIDRMLFLAPTNGIVNQTRAYGGMEVVGRGCLPVFQIHRNDVLRHCVDFLRISDGNAYGTECASPFHATSYPAFSRNPEAQELAHALGDRLLVVVDESQHAPNGSREEATRIARSVEGLRMILRIGGTGRSDRQPIPGRLIERSLAMHMLAGFTPHPLQVEILEVDGQAMTEDTEENERDFFGIPGNYREAIRVILNHHEREGRPRSILRVKASPDVARTSGIVADCRQLMDASRLTYVDGSGRDGDDRLNPYLLKEGCNSTGTRACYADLEDFLLLVRRGDEGLDLVSRSHLYIFGIPRSIELLEQLIGRTLRLRRRAPDDPTPLFDGYPARWLDVSKVVFVVPRNRNEEVSRVLLQATMYISDMSSQIETIRELRVDDGFGGSSPESDPPVLPPRYHELVNARRLVAAQMMSAPEIWPTPERWRISANQWATMILEFAAHVRETQDETSRLYHEVGRLGAEDRRDIQQAVIFERAATSAEQRDLLRRYMNEQRLIGRSWNERLDEAVTRMLDAFCDETLVNARMHELTGDVIIEYGRRLRDIVCNPDMPRTHAALRERIDGFRSTHDGRFPLVRGDRDLDPVSGATFHDYDRDLRQGLIGAPVEGGFGTFYIRPDWARRLHVIAEEVEGLLSGVDPGTASMDTSRLRTIEGLSRQYQREPEMVYFPYAWRVCRDETFPASIIEANRLGREMPR